MFERRWAAVGLLVFLMLTGEGQAALRARDSVQASDAFNPVPAAGDIVLPMPGGGSMVFRAIGIRAENVLSDFELPLGCAEGLSEQRALYDGRRSSAVAGPFRFSELPGDWQKAVLAAAAPGQDARTMHYLFVGKYEVSRAQWKLIMEPAEAAQGNTAAGAGEAGVSAEDLLPVVGISWFDAQEFSRRYTEWLLQNAPGSLPKFAGDTRNTAYLRLPVESEWEYAARGAQFSPAPVLRQGDFFELPEGSSMADFAVFRGGATSVSELQRIGTRRANPAGLHDTAGNAAEMTQDAFHFTMGGRLHGAAGGFVRKGGSYLSSQADILPGRREEAAPFLRDGVNKASDLGFRLALSGINTPGGVRPSEIEEAWRRAGVELSAALNPSGDPLELVRALREKASTDQERASLSGLEQLIRENNMALERQKRASIDNAIRSSVYLVTMLKDCQIKRGIIETELKQFEEKKKQVTASLKGMKAAEAAQYKQLLDKLDKAVAASRKGITVQDTEFRSLLLFYKQTLENGRDWPNRLFAGQMDVLRQEFAADAAYLIKQRASFAVYEKHMQALYGGRLDRLSSEAITRDILSLVPGKGKTQ